MKTWTKSLIAAGVVAIHALAFAATVQPAGDDLQARQALAQVEETEWLLPEVLVTARAGGERGQRGSRHAARFGEECARHCGDGAQQMRPRHT